MRRSSLLTAVFVFVLCSATSAFAQTVDRQLVEQALSAIEGVPGKAALERLGGAGMELLLHAIVKQPSKRVLARVRALTVLRYYPSQTTQALLRREIAATQRARRGLPLIYLGQALRSYAVVRGPAALALVGAQLGHPSIDVRVAAAEAVRLSRAPTARTLLLARVKLDGSATVRAEIDRQLRLLDGKHP